MQEDDGTPGDAGVQPVEERAREVKGVLQRSPKYSVFIVSGIAVGLVVAVVVTFFAGGRAQGYSLGSQLGYLCAIFGLLGALLGGGVAVLLDRPRR